MGVKMAMHMDLQNLRYVETCKIAERPHVTFA